MGHRYVDQQNPDCRTGIFRAKTCRHVPFARLFRHPVPMPIVEPRDYPGHLLIPLQRRGHRTEEVRDHLVRVDAKAIPVERFTDLLLEPFAVLDESLVFHVLEHLLELRTPAVFGGIPPLGDLELGATRQRIERADVVGRHVAVRTARPQALDARVPSVLNDALRTFAEALVDRLRDQCRSAGTPADGSAPEPRLQR
jgi:hypothetical protein